MGVWGDWVVQSHSMGGVRGRAEGHTGMQRNEHANVAPAI